MADWDQGNQASNEDASWLEKVKKKVDKVSGTLTSNWSICEVPIKLRNVNSDAYNPQIISIGPLHSGKTNLQSMETHKIHYADFLFRRTADAVEACDACGNAMFGLIDEVRAYYKEPLTKFTEDMLAEILLFDGCFILELFLRYSSNLSFQHDPVFTTSWMITSLRRDLALLENQIPLKILDKLYSIVAMRCSSLNPLGCTLKELALRFFKSAMGVDDETIAAVASQQSGNHLLHLLHNCYAFPKTRPSTQEGLVLIECATALEESGIKFQIENAKNILNVSFKNGVFELPRLVIHDLTDSLFRNLIAFEQCCHRDAQYVSSYVLLMDRLVDTAADVELLERQRIIENNLGGDDDVSEFFNNICKEVVVQEFYFAELSKTVNDYFGKKRHRYCATLKRDYFKNPWTIISFIAGFVLLVLTFLQTLYSVMSYYHR